MHRTVFGLASVLLGFALMTQGTRFGYSQLLTAPRAAGKPDPRWRSFDWLYTDIDLGQGQGTYRLYFYDEERWTAEFVIPTINEQIRNLSRIFDFVPPKSFSYILFSTQWDWRQADVFNVTEGVQGITSTTEPTMAIPYWGDIETFRHISTHEMVHQFQVQKTMAQKGQVASRTLSRIPLWFIEGMAEFYSLNGIDQETAVYVRDLMAHPRPGKGLEPAYKLPKLFESGPLSFVYIYKIGQVKLDFFEKEFGPGTIQQIFKSALAELSTSDKPFSEVVAKVLNVSVGDLEKRWQTYLSKTYSLETFTQPLSSFQRVEQAGETIDAFALAPDGNLIAIREVDPLTGVASIFLLDVQHDYQRTLVARDHQPRLITLFFMQEASLALSRQWVAYAVGTTAGPELEYRRLYRMRTGRVEIGDARRIPLHEQDILQVHSISISPDGEKIAFIGLDRRAWENLYIIDLKQNNINRFTDDYYAYVTTHWSVEGLFVASNRYSKGQRDIFRVDLDSSTLYPLVAHNSDELSPFFDKRRLFFQSDASGSPQIHSIQDGREVRLTDAPTLLKSPQFSNRGHLYTLGLQSGRYRLFRVPSEKFLEIFVSDRRTIVKDAWLEKPRTFLKNETQEYEPFKSSGIRIDMLGAALAGSEYGGFFGEFSDLMRNYTVAASASARSGLGLTGARITLSSRKGRTNWVTGVYAIDQFLIDNVFPEDPVPATYLYEEYSVLGALQYPLGVYTYLRGGISIGAVQRSLFSDPEREALWNDQNPGLEPVVEPALSFGHDEILYEAFTGPIAGWTALVDVALPYFWTRNATAPRVRFDLGIYKQIVGRTVFLMEGIAGTTWGDRFRRPFYLFGDEILRAYPMGDRRLLGNNFAAIKAELRFPIGTFFGFPPLRGLVAYDYGAVSRKWKDLSRRTAASRSFGLNLNVPPLSLGFIWTQPQYVAPGPKQDMVMHILIEYLYF